MMRHSIIGYAAMATILLGAGTASAADQISGSFGNWSRDDGEAKVRIAACGKSICATNTWIKADDSSEKVGDKLVMTLKPSGAATWTGQAYDPQRKMTYSMTMTMNGGKLQTRGCVLGGILCRNVGWTRLR